MTHPRTRELLEYLDEQRAALRAAFESVPPPQRDQAPGAGQWSTAGIIEHLAIVETRVSTRLSALIADARAACLGAEPSLEPVLPTLGVEQVVDRTNRVAAPEVLQPTGLSADAAWAALEEAGKKVRDVLQASDGLAVGTLSMPHPLFGPLSAYHWLAFVGGHEARHAAQIREIADELNGPSSALQNDMNSELTRTHATVSVRARQGGPDSAGQSGDTQGLPDREEGDSESVTELLEEGQSFEAEAILGVEDAPDADVAEVHTRQLPEDDVPGEYLDRD